MNRLRNAETFGIKEEEQIVKDKSNLEDGELAEDEEKKVSYMIYMFFYYVMFSFRFFHSLIYMIVP